MRRITPHFLMDEMGEIFDFKFSRCILSNILSKGLPRLG